MLWAWFIHDGGSDTGCGRKLLVCKYWVALRLFYVQFRTVATTIN